MVVGREEVVKTLGNCGRRFARSRQQEYSRLHEYVTVRCILNHQACNSGKFKEGIYSILISYNLSIINVLTINGLVEQIYAKICQMTHCKIGEEKLAVLVHSVHFMFGLPPSVIPRSSGTRTNFTCSRRTATFGASQTPIFGRDDVVVAGAGPGSFEFIRFRGYLPFHLMVV